MIGTNFWSGLVRRAVPMQAPLAAGGPAPSPGWAVLRGQVLPV